jgi:hypothetical protein
MASIEEPDSEFQQFLRDRAETLGSRAREAGFFGHRATTGTARGNVLQEPLRELLPERYGVTGGIVRSSDGSRSTQWDVLIYDRLETPRLYKRDAAAVLPIEGILAAISVKSTADKESVKDACGAARVLRDMERRTLPPAAPPGCQVQSGLVQQCFFLVFGASHSRR